MGIGIQQLCAAFQQLNREPVPLRYRRSHDEPRGRDDEHEEPVHWQHLGGRTGVVQTNHDAKIQSEQADDNSPDSLTHRNPDDRNEGNKEDLKVQKWGSEQHPQRKQQSADLTRQFDEFPKTPWSSERPSPRSI